MVGKQLPSLLTRLDIIEGTPRPVIEALNFVTPNSSDTVARALEAIMAAECSKQLTKDGYSVIRNDLSVEFFPETCLRHRPGQIIYANVKPAKRLARVSQ